MTLHDADSSDVPCFRVRGVPTFLYGGEIHYFRLDPACWADRLAEARRLGLNMVASYIPWIWHEPTEATFDFSGGTHPQRDLVRFIDLVAEHGLFFLPRIGPVSNAELVGEGIPRWLFERYPDAQLRRRDGSYFAGVPSYCHPTFLGLVGRWYRALLPHLTGRAAERGGPIVAVQLCNEIDMPTWLSRQPDHHEHVGARWAARASDGSAVQPDGLVDAWPSPRHTRWMAFYAEYFADYVRHLAELSAELAAPCLVNLAQCTDHFDRGRAIQAPLTATMFRDMASAVEGLVLGGDYYPRHLDYDNFHDVVIASEVVRMISSPRSPIACPELQAGGNEDRPRVCPSDVELLLHTAAGNGLGMLNLYMLAGGKNPADIGLFGVEHDWQAPLAADGTRRPHAAAIERFGDFLRAEPSFAATRKRVDTHFGFYAPYFQTEYLRGEPVEALERRRVEMAQDGLLRLLSLANIHYDFVDLARREYSGIKTLWVFAEDWMDEACQRRLLEFVENGGRLMLFPTVPTRGADGSPCTVLARALGLVPELADTRHVHFDTTTLPLFGRAATFRASSTDTALARVDDGRVCAIVREHGRGRVLAVGFGMRHRFDRQVTIARTWAERLGVSPHLAVESDGLIVVSRDDGAPRPRDVFVTMLNYHEVPCEVRGTIAVADERRPLPRLSLPGRSACTTRVEVSYASR